MSPVVVMVGGGKGGVGKSSVTAGLARSLRNRGVRVGVVDLDLAGPSQAILFGCTQMPVRDGRVWPAESHDDDTSRPPVLVASIGLVAQDSTALVWSDATASAAVRMLAGSPGWADAALLVVDLPPGHNRITSDVVELFPDAYGVLVTTGSELALEECRRAGTFFRRTGIALLGVVENMSFTRCGHCGRTTPTFDGESVATTAAELGLPIAARVALGDDVAAGAGLQDLAERLLGFVRPAAPLGQEDTR